MKIKNMKQKMIYIITIGISIFLLFFVITCSWIGFEVKSQCQNAQRQYGGDCVKALITLLNNEKGDFRSRNDAIWTLGQLGDIKALPILRSYYTGNIPPRESLYETISQYELKKAINLTSGGFNISAIVWRYGLINKGIK
jgi:hypothetical protein